MSERRFFVKQNGYKEVIVTWEVYASSFDEAVERVHDGYADLYDEDEYDTDYNDIEEVICDDCECDESDCECETESANEFLAEIGL